MNASIEIVVLIALLFVLFTCCIFFTVYYTDHYASPLYIIIYFLGVFLTGITLFISSCDIYQVRYPSFIHTIEVLHLLNLSIYAYPSIITIFQTFYYKTLKYNGGRYYDLQYILLGNYIFIFIVGQILLPLDLLVSSSGYSSRVE